MDLCDGNLRQFLTETSIKFELKDFLKILHEIIGGLSFFHSKELAHMDIKLGSAGDFTINKSFNYLSHYILHARKFALLLR